ncbi:protein CHUP1, chloroplastic-like [Abrus precatorius]|uniref:Protein CHUP1, chloroplastic-like n=1 Tax=Abrus precatorius TaxID=3816 RepID=A0A8B8MKS6_ABRPR|nr:protein CHUP1, chloroplastic-like [Abrus precatorius]
MHQIPIQKPNCSCVQDYMVIRVSFMVVASIAALKISQTKNSSATKRNGAIKSPGRNGYLEQEFEERENSNSDANHVTQNDGEKEINIEMPQNMPTPDFKDFELLIDGEKTDNVTEKEILQNLVQNYKERKVNIERKLLELNGLREEQSAIAQMQRQLETKTAKLDSLKKTIASLQSESKMIREKIRDNVLSKKQLDLAKRMINEMQRKNGVNRIRVKEKILMLHQQVTDFQKYNSSGRIAMPNTKLKDVQDIVLEILELKRRNKELELEKREMGIKLANAQARIKTELVQEEREARIKEEITGLRRLHEDLSEQVERLQRNRFDMVQEVVYQRWVYTLLKFEVYDHQKQRGKALTSDPELESVSSNATLDESDQVETTTFESSSSSQSSTGSNSSIVSKIKRWRKTKDYPNKISSKGTNMNSGMNSSTKQLEIPTVPKVKKVSFSDSVKLTNYQDMPEGVENAMHEKYDEPRKSNECAVGDTINVDSIPENEGAKIKIGHSDELYSRNDPVCRKDQRVKTILHLTRLFNATLDYLET